MGHFFRLLTSDSQEAAKLVLKYVGLNPYYQNGFTKLWVVAYSVTSVILFSLCLYLIAKSLDDTGTMTLAMESMGFFCHGFGKLLSGMVNQKRLLKLFTKKQHFWSWDKFNPKLETSCRNVRNVLSAACNIFVVLGQLVMTLFFVKGLFTEKNKLPVLIYIPDGQEVVFFSLDYMVATILVEIIMFWDLLFFCLCADTILQVKLLNFAFKSLNFAERNNNGARVDKELATFIEHHELLLDYCTEIGRACTFSFFGEYAVCILTTCFELYMTFENPDITFFDILRGFIYMLTLTVQLSLYCVIAEYLSTEIEQLSWSIYESNWYMCPDTKIQKKIILILIRNQKYKCMRAGDVININMPTILSIFKTAFSFFTAMKAVT